MKAASGVIILASISQMQQVYPESVRAQQLEVDMERCHKVGEDGCTFVPLAVVFPGPAYVSDSSHYVHGRC
jgi:hypothetical protein